MQSGKRFASKSNWADLKYYTVTNYCHKVNSVVTSMSRFQDKNFAQDFWIIQSRQIILPSVTSRTLSCSSASCLACWSGDRMAVKLSMSACFSERFLSSAAAAMLIEGKMFCACECFGGKIFEQDLTADQIFSYSVGACWEGLVAAAAPNLGVFTDCKYFIMQVSWKNYLSFTYYIRLACEQAQAWGATSGFLSILE